MRAQRGDILPEGGGCGEDGELIQQCRDLGRRNIIREATSEPQHASGEPGDHCRHLLAGLAGRCTEAAAQMREVGPRIPQ